MDENGAFSQIYFLSKIGYATIAVLPDLENE